VAAVAAELGAEVVDDDRRTALGKQERICAAEAAARSGHDRDSPVEAQPHEGHLDAFPAEPPARSRRIRGVIAADPHVSTGELRRRTGWELKPEGACKG